MGLCEGNGVLLFFFVLLMLLFLDREERKGGVELKCRMRRGEAFDGVALQGEKGEGFLFLMMLLFWTIRTKRRYIEIIRLGGA